MIIQTKYNIGDIVKYVAMDLEKVDECTTGRVIGITAVIKDSSKVITYKVASIDARYYPIVKRRESQIIEKLKEGEDAISGEGL